MQLPCFSTPLCETSVLGAYEPACEKGVVAKVQSQRRSHLLRNVRNTPTRTYYKYLSIPTEELNSTSNAYDTEYRTLVYSTVNFYTTTNNYIVSSTYNFPSSTITRKPDYTSLSLYAAVSDYTPVSHYKLRLHSHLFKSHQFQPS